MPGQRERNASPTRTAQMDVNELVLVRNYHIQDHLLVQLLRFLEIAPVVQVKHFFPDKSHNRCNRYSFPSLIC